jgi:hypothetical protein
MLYTIITTLNNLQSMQMNVHYLVTYLQVNKKSVQQDNVDPPNVQSETPVRLHIIHIRSKIRLSVQFWAVSHILEVKCFIFFNGHYLQRDMLQTSDKVVTTIITERKKDLDNIKPSDAIRWNMHSMGSSDYIHTCILTARKYC